MSAPGIEVRHGRGCPVETDAAGRCRCKPGPSYRASVWSRRDGKRIRRTFPTLAAAKAWRADAMGAVSKGTMSAPSKMTLREAADEWMEGARAGTIRNRSGDVFKPATLRGYEQALRDRILPELGARRLAGISRRDVLDLVERLQAEGRDPSTIRNAVAPLRVIYRRALDRGDVAINPTIGLKLPAVRGKRDRIADSTEAAELIGAVPETDRALWATAFYAGLRSGELQALRWEDVDLASGLIRVERAYDPKARQFIEPKSKAGTRKVPIPAALRESLIEWNLRSGRTAGLVFGRTPESPVDVRALVRRAETAWKNANPKLEPISPHEARHTFASLMIAAGVNAKALSTYLGHSSIQITFDTYGHLMPGNEEEAAGLLDAYLARAMEAAGR
ncbi:site-specific integrase [soil metagenome]